MNNIKNSLNTTARCIKAKALIWAAAIREKDFNKINLIAVVLFAVIAIYWTLIASDRYVSESKVIIQRTDLGLSPTVDFSSLLGGGSNNNRPDQLLLREHLLSIDMLHKLDKALNLKAHYSDSANDFVTRLWSDDVPLEWFHRYFLKRVKVEFDDYAGVLVIRTQGFTPEIAHDINSMMVLEGERFMNDIAHHLAENQVAFLEAQVARINATATAARTAVTDYQNQKGLVSPQGTTESIAAIIAQLEGQRTSLQTLLSSYEAYLVPTHSSVVQTRQQLDAVERQIKDEQAKLAAPTGKALNRTIEEFQRLELEAQFAFDMYKTALAALEKGRIEATRTIKKVSILQSPSMPEYPLQPRRTYNTFVFLILISLLAGLAHLLIAIVRDHKD